MWVESMCALLGVGGVGVEGMWWCMCELLGNIYKG